MENVDWDLEDDPTPELVPFAENQVGSVTLSVEPVHSDSPIGWVAEQFQANSDLFALPVEREGGVVGLVSRVKVLERTTKFFNSLSGRPLDHDLAPHAAVDARESIDKVVNALFNNETQPLADLFLVYLGGRYFGITNLRLLVSRAALLRDQDLAKAREVQERSLDRSRLPATSWQRSRLVRMAYGVGGDFYQEISWKDGTCLLGCFDVAGKGVSAALVTSALGGFFGAARSEDQASPSPEGFATRLNAFLCEVLPLGTFVTAVLFFLNAQTGPEAVLQVLNFGYGPVPVFRSGADEEPPHVLQPNLPPLGLDSLELGAEFRQVVPFPQGTKVYLFSDGLSDLMDPSGIRWGEERVQAFLTKHRTATPPAFLDALKNEIDLWQRDAPQADDITALMIQA